MQPKLDTPTDFFPRILDGVRRRISSHQFDTWFGRVAFSSLSEKDLVVAVPNAFHQEWMGKEFKGAVHRAATEVLGRAVDVRFTVDPSLRAIQPVTPPPPSASETAAPEPVISGPGADSAPPPARAPIAPARPAPTPRPAARSTTPVLASDDLAGPFPIVLDPRYTFENFILGPSNQIAYASARAVADNPSRSTNPLFIYGSVGLGKTHLLQAVCHELLRRHPDFRIVYLSCEVFTNQFVYALQCNRLDAFRERYRKADMLVVDDIHFLAGKERTQEEFFHTFNALHQHGRQVVLSSDAPPSDIPTLEERLVSRFRWGLVERLERPETETRMAILRHKAEAVGLALPSDVVDYITSNVRDNVREIEGALASVRTRSELENRPVDLALARSALEATLARERPVVGLDRIVEIVGAHFGVKAGDLKSSKRTKSISFPRQVVMHTARRVTTLSLEEIGDYFGGRDHTTVLYAVQKVDDVLRRDDELRSTVNTLVDRVLAR
jgi:chromosomal replication initiator protein